jgi:uncharacterized membrane protein YedE/YeeE
MSNSGPIMPALISGILFGAGLVISGMTDPTKVIGFLDLLNGWDPTLAFVLAGATGSHMIARQLLKDKIPEKFESAKESKESVDNTLIIGSVMFGMGWGLGGYCPGPALTAVIPAMGTTLVFTISMLVGMAIYRWTQHRNTAQTN